MLDVPRRTVFLRTMRHEVVTLVAQTARMRDMDERVRTSRTGECYTRR